MAEQAPTTRGIRVGAVVWSTLRSPDAVAAALSFVRTALTDFFWLQFRVKWRLRRVPVVSVDHPLDAGVPFSPDRIDAYLDFVAFWIRPLGHIGRRFGQEAQYRYTVEFLELIERCYREAADVYRDQMSTTRRPRYYKGRFLAIHLLDPHYLCVPSLHVMVVVLAWTFYRRAFAELGADAEEAAALNRELFDGAAEITETVLYIKQHSVNCIPAALYAMSRITPGDFTPADAAAFMERLFVDAPAVSDTDAAGIRESIRDTFDRLTDEGRSDAEWAAPVRRMLASLGGVDLSTR